MHVNGSYQADEAICIKHEVVLVSVNIPDNSVHSTDLVVGWDDL